jgi:hypothetical protein
MLDTRIPVYWSSTSSRQQPDFSVPLADALRLRQNGEAYPIKRGRALRMLVADAFLIPAPTHIVVHDESCIMGERVIVANAAGERWAGALVDGWKKC